ncbi:Polyketide cyclase/dehydrase [Haloterrigena turkmenica DSM 5511]|uniref:Polyketide cyclase/dehydrase n=1 Tax=Haloterrigena turkmenica (strain ATCC 51198 / DSM 5511 / JCM 9101 / NCIMB 13204 / VKM B-1734 / 4k) TaxID=543526 RepID=D2RQ83_HALTV|nr:SRPBCC family protein [Haloterrigena turkmenica]ADB62260.1 Polyketide cyclase/dehydrase [Haloterrigena turkmenica DSM 5511]
MSEHSFDSAAEDVSNSMHPGASAGAEPNRSRWKRVGTVALGGALVAFGLRRRSLGGTVLALVGGALSYRTLSDYLADAGGTEPVERSVTIDKPADELSDLARDPENLERIVGHFADVSAVGDDRYRWSAGGPLARELSWEMEIAADESGERLRWETIDDDSMGALFDAWSLSFDSAPGDRGTEVTLEVRFDPPGGTAGSAAVERLDVVPESLIGTALDRFKSLAETGTVPTTEHRPSARGRGDLL